MAKYNVSVPVVALVCAYDVEADNEDDAIESILSRLTGDFTPKLYANDGDAYDESGEVECLEWEALRRIAEGNVLHTYNNTAEAELSDVQDED